MQVPMMLIRMRCPECQTDGRFLAEITLPLAALPEVAKQLMMCRCRMGIPRIDKNTSLDESLMSINGVPLRTLKEQAVGMN